MSRMPNFYRPPLMLPLYWGDEVTGELPRAVESYYAWVVEKKTPLTSEQITLLIDYAQYFINAPCWEPSSFAEELAQLRLEATQLKSVEDIDRWIDHCMDIAVDLF